MIPLLLRWRTVPVLGRMATQILRLYGVDVPALVKLGKDVAFWHRGQGVIISPHTVIGDRVHIFQQVTIGGADPLLRHGPGTFEGVHIEDDAILCAGAKVLAGSTLLTVGRGTIIAANAVLLTSTGENEIWGGIPARRIGERPSDQLRNTPPGAAPDPGPQQT